MEKYTKEEVLDSITFVVIDEQRLSQNRIDFELKITECLYSPCIDKTIDISIMNDTDVLNRLKSYVRTIMEYQLEEYFGKSYLGMEISLGDE